MVGFFFASCKRVDISLLCWNDTQPFTGSIIYSPDFVVNINGELSIETLENGEKKIHLKFEKEGNGDEKKEISKVDLKLNKENLVVEVEVESISGNSVTIHNKEGETKNILFWVPREHLFGMSLLVGEQLFGMSLSVPNG